MENRKLNEQVMKRVRNKIVVSNLEREENMKLNRKKQILSLSVIAIVLASGSFASVNAATNGKLVENIKDFVKVNFIKADGTKEEIQKTNTYTDQNGDTWVTYERKENGSESRIDINQSVLEKEKMNLDVEHSQGETNITIKEE